MRHAILGATAGIALIFSGCGKPSDVAGNSAAPPPTPPSATNNSPPAQARKTATIAGVPLVFTIPGDWKSVPPISQGYLQGPGPAGQITVGVSILDFMDDFRRGLYVSNALDEAHKHPFRTHTSQSTTAEGLQV